MSSERCFHLLALVRSVLSVQLEGIVERCGSSGFTVNPDIRTYVIPHFQARWRAMGTLLRPTHLSRMSRRRHDEETTVGSVGALGILIVLVTSLLAHWATGNGLLDDPPKARVVHIQPTKPSDEASAKHDAAETAFNVIDSGP